LKNGKQLISEVGLTQFLFDCKRKVQKWRWYHRKLRGKSLSTQR